MISEFRRASEYARAGGIRGDTRDPDEFRREDEDLAIMTNGLWALFLFAGMLTTSLAVDRAREWRFGTCGWRRLLACSCALWCASLWICLVAGGGPGVGAAVWHVWMAQAARMLACSCGVLHCALALSLVMDEPRRRCQFHTLVCAQHQLLAAFCIVNLSERTRVCAHMCSAVPPPPGGLWRALHGGGVDWPLLLTAGEQHMVQEAGG